MIVKCLQEVFWQNFEFFETYEQVSVHFTLNSAPCRVWEVSKSTNTPLTLSFKQKRKDTDFTF